MYCLSCNIRNNMKHLILLYGMFLFGLWIAHPQPVLADSPTPPQAEKPLSDIAQETRALSLFRKLRCMVCSGESIAESPADIASIIRRDVRARIANGEQDAEILASLAQTYGESILMEPPYEGMHLFILLCPLLVLLLGGTLVYRYFSTPIATK